ncbi:MAG: putative hemagglutinin/hemolysin-related protein, partial [Hyphomicrobiales bacterium]|nr:putative hemagglutinin/hemolysin-related protein [Hyphomicrobiales bacterium]
MFDTATDLFTYQLSDGHDGLATATLTINVVNSPFVIKGAPGTYSISDATGGASTVIETVVIPADGSLIWIPPDTYNPADGSHVLSVSNGANLSLFGGTASSTVHLEILDVAHLPETAADNTLYIVHDTRAHLSNEDASPIAALLTNHAIMGIILNGGAAAGGSYETVTNALIPVIGYDTQISLPASARTVNEDENNTGRLIAFKGTGLAIAVGTEVESSVGPVITDADGNDAVGAMLRVHINNAVSNALGGDVLFLKQGSNLFRTDSSGNIYYRQGTTIDGDTSDAVKIDSDPTDDVQFAAFTTNASGKLMNGMGGRDLVVGFNESATVNLVQLLAGHIGFGIRLNTTDGTAAYTQAWEQFLPAQGVQQSVTFTITDAAGRSNSATRDINVQAVNDAPVAVADAVTTLKSVAVNGFVLANDTDADNIAGLAASQTLTVTNVNAQALSTTNATSIAGAYGTLSISASGAYTYTPDQTKAAVNALGAGQQLSEQFSYSVSDGHGGIATSALTVTVNGTANATLSLPAMTTTLNEDQDNYGRLVGFNGAGLNIFSGSADAGNVGVTLTGASIRLGSSLTASIENRQGFGGVAGEVLFMNPNLFRVDADGKVYYRQDTQNSGKEGYVDAAGRTYRAGEAVITDSNPLDDILVGALAPEKDSAGLATGNWLDGKQGRELSIMLADGVSPERVQLLAANIGFGVWISGGDGTQAWGRFASASPQPIVHLKLYDGSAA